MPAKKRRKVFICRTYCASLSEGEINLLSVWRKTHISHRSLWGAHGGRHKENMGEHSTVISLRDKPAAESQMIKPLLMCQHGHGNEVYKVSDAAQWTAHCKKIVYVCVFCMNNQPLNITNAKNDLGHFSFDWSKSFRETWSYKRRSQEWKNTTCFSDELQSVSKRFQWVLTEFLSTKIWAESINFK